MLHVSEEYRQSKPFIPQPFGISGARGGRTTGYGGFHHFAAVCSCCPQVKFEAQSLAAELDARGVGWLCGRRGRCGRFIRRWRDGGRRCSKRGSSASKCSRGRLRWGASRRSWRASYSFGVLSCVQTGSLASHAGVVLEVWYSFDVVPTNGRSTEDRT